MGVGWGRGGGAVGKLLNFIQQKNSKQTPLKSSGNQGIFNINHLTNKKLNYNNKNNISMVLLTNCCCRTVIKTVHLSVFFLSQKPLSTKKY